MKSSTLKYKVEMVYLTPIIQSAQNNSEGEKQLLTTIPNTTNPSSFHSRMKFAVPYLSVIKCTYREKQMNAKQFV